MDQGVGDQTVIAAAAGDSGALRVLLYAAHEPTLRRIARRIPLDIERSVAPEDVLQDTFAEVFKHVDTLKTLNYAGFLAWVRTIADNRVESIRRAHRSLKRGGGRPVVELAEAESLMASLSAASRSPRSWLAQREHIEIVRAALEDLQPSQRDVIHMRFMRGLDYAQIGNQLGRSPGAVRMLAMRALRYLRAMVDGASTTRPPRD